MSPTNGNCCGNAIFSSFGISHRGFGIGFRKIQGLSKWKISLRAFWEIAKCYDKVLSACTYF